MDESRRAWEPRNEADCRLRGDGFATVRRSRLPVKTALDCEGRAEFSDEAVRSIEGKSDD